MITVTELPTGNLLAQRGNDSLEFHYCHRRGGFVYPIRIAGRPPKTVKLTWVVKKWAEEIFNCRKFKWSSIDE